MPYKRRSYSKGRSSFSRRSFKRSRSGSRSGQYRAASQGRSSDRTVIKVQTDQSFEVSGEKTDGSRLLAGTAVYAFPVYELLNKTRVFDVQRDMYDQFHVDGVKITLRPQGAIQQSGTAFQLIMAFDRNGVYNNFLTLDELSQYSNKRDIWQYVNQMKTLSSTIFASTMTEKSFYLPTDTKITNCFQDLGDIPHDQFRFDINKQRGMTTAGVMSSWCPTLLVGIKTNPVPTTGVSTYSFTMDISFWITYRGQRILGVKEGGQPGPGPEPAPPLVNPASPSQVVQGQQFFLDDYPNVHVGTMIYEPLSNPAREWNVDLYKDYFSLGQEGDLQLRQGVRRTEVAYDFQWNGVVIRRPSMRTDTLVIPESFMPPVNKMSQVTINPGTIIFSIRETEPTRFTFSAIIAKHDQYSFAMGQRTLAILCTYDTQLDANLWFQMCLTTNKDILKYDNQALANDVYQPILDIYIASNASSVYSEDYLDQPVSILTNQPFYFFVEQGEDVVVRDLRAYFDELPWINQVSPE